MQGRNREAITQKELNNLVSKISKLTLAYKESLHFYDHHDTLKKLEALIEHPLIETLSDFSNYAHLLRTLYHCVDVITEDANPHLITLKKLLIKELIIQDEADWIAPSADRPEHESISWAINTLQLHSQYNSKADKDFAEKWNLLDSDASTNDKRYTKWKEMIRLFPRHLDESRYTSPISDTIRLLGVPQHESFTPHRIAVEYLSETTEERQEYIKPAHQLTDEDMQDRKDELKVWNVRNIRILFINYIIDSQASNPDESKINNQIIEDLGNTFHRMLHTVNQAHRFIQNPAEYDPSYKIQGTAEEEKEKEQELKDTEEFMECAKSLEKYSNEEFVQLKEKIAYIPSHVGFILPSQKKLQEAKLLAEAANLRRSKRVIRDLHHQGIPSEASCDEISTEKKSTPIQSEHEESSHSDAEDDSTDDEDRSLLAPPIRTSSQLTANPPAEPVAEGYSNIQKILIGIAIGIGLALLVAGVVAAIIFSAGAAAGAGVATGGTIAAKLGTGGLIATFSGIGVLGFLGGLFGGIAATQEDIELDPVITPVTPPAGLTNGAHLYSRLHNSSTPNLGARPLIRMDTEIHTPPASPTSPRLLALPPVQNQQTSKTLTRSVSLR